jgi:hypothetical protein
MAYEQTPYINPETPGPLLWAQEGVGICYRGGRNLPLRSESLRRWGVEKESVLQVW